MGQFIYVFGEHQSAFFELSDQVMQFTQENMAQIDTEELRLVLGNVFGKGEFFPGPQEVVTSVLHELVRRWEPYTKAFEGGKKHSACVYVTALRLLDGTVMVRPLTVARLKDEGVQLDDEKGFYTLLMETLPSCQGELAKTAYAPDSKVVGLIKDAAAYHRRK
ncbi:hypothetical protein [Desulfogranum japonicum]|uniref:hypothetical protein n=1 Tax=Desulfogranum japonicum TaxID=231447 RepID=UPI000491E400|nr:hypothetical protein [Desulfogranum japonicum]